MKYKKILKYEDKQSYKIINENKYIKIILDIQKYKKSHQKCVPPFVVLS